MRRALLGLATCALGLALTAGSAHAHAPHAPAANARVAYYRQHGVAFGGGYYYAGLHHNHWSQRVWNPFYHRYHYFDPYLRCWYYWYPAGNCYYPVTYCP
jgi:hypothetical protein